MIDVALLVSAAGRYEMEITQKQALLLDKYAQFLVEYNEKVNLTAITQPDEIVIKHFIDSMLLLRYYNAPVGAKLCDVGSGAGFPGVVAAVMRPDLKICLLDSLNKRIVFLRQLCEMLEVGVQCVHIRAEQAGTDSAFRESFDIVTARAVAPLAQLAEYCLPLCGMGGAFLALKGIQSEQELTEALPAIKVLGGGVATVHRYDLGESGKRTLIEIKKISQTPTIYPRTQSKIASKPII